MFNKKNIVLLLLLVAATTIKAQNRKPADTTGTILAQKLNIPAERAKNILAALNYHYDELVKIMQDKNIPPDKKQPMLSKLVAERSRFINSVTTAEERQKLAVLNANAEKMLAVDRQKINAQNEAVLSARGVKTGN